MRKEIIEPDGVYPPTAAFSQAIRVSGSDLVFLSGIIGMRVDGTMPETAAEQIDLAFRNLARVMDASGGTMADIVKVTLFIRDDFALIRDDLRAIRARYFTSEYPVSTLVQVAGFAGADYLFEIEAIAVLPPEPVE
ncbi:RidA family protein [Microbacterium sp. 2FI]|uniref:RidA family protein n=1 Tax=Microbacterium sp. 2FI TaxID=2502193 RepID=UPI001485736A|nr:RidA family protein [Microbacterium sp. 2FI]